jgi:hypothetical protein
MVFFNDFEFELYIFFTGTLPLMKKLDHNSHKRLKLP